MRKILKALFGWGSLAVLGGVLAVVSWPWAGHWVSIFWIIVAVSVLLAELLNKLFSPKKQTVSQNIQDEAITDPIRFWVVIAVWLLFAFTLAGHFMVRLF